MKRLSAALVRSTPVDFRRKKVFFYFLPRMDAELSYNIA